ncbi:MAG TPA: ABC transporter permease, partial [Acidimicrobiales bacterium]|nr:ABC transporter permease [Acidimicrobiales bacterium]
MHRVLANGNCRLGGAILLAFVVAAALAPLLAPQDPLLITGERLRSPSGAHLLGTDGLGRDILSRVLFGARASLSYAAVAALLVMTIGALVGTVAGYFGGLVDTVLMRLVDIILALPGLVLSLAIAGLFEPSLTAVLFGLVSVWWVGYARIVRSLVLSVRERDYVDAARALGSGSFRLIARHIVPNVAPSVLVLVTLRMGRLILAISGLSFLGLGAQPPTAEWGAMLNESRPYFPSYPHLMLAPGMAISLVVVGLNLL